MKSLPIAESPPLEKAYLHVEKYTHKYYNELNGLRAFAIFFVLIEHWLKDGNIIKELLPWGSIGVGLFFVLSGFLIGRILLVEKQNTLIKGKSKSEGIKKFFIRRSLRIFPIYFIFLAVLYLFNYPDFIRPLFPYFATYTTNIFIFFNYGPWPLSHLWTLAIEEQFYLIFPFLIILIPDRKILLTLVLFILMGMICRSTLYLSGFEFFNWFTISTFDYFGFGALLAYMDIKKIKIPNITLLFSISLCLFFFFASNFGHFKGKSLLGILLPIQASVYAMIIYFLINGNSHWIKKILTSKFLILVGKISYGIYLFHTIIPYVRESLFPTISLNSYTSFAVDFIITFCISFLSFTLIENPINGLKRHFKYD